MKKLFSNDKNLRFVLKIIYKKYFILKSITKNKQFFLLIRFQAYLKLKKLVNLISVVSIVKRCFSSINSKSFNKFTLFSRFIFLKLIQMGKMYGFKKSVW